MKSLPPQGAPSTFVDCFAGGGLNLGLIPPGVSLEAGRFPTDRLVARRQTAQKEGFDPR
jgi:hypothetical protein